MSETQNTEGQEQVSAEQVAAETAELHKQIKANFNNKVDVRAFKFHFKKNELGVKRPTVEVDLPVPSVEGLIEILETGGKGLEYLLEVCADAVASQARSIVNDTEDINQANFPLDKLAWDVIANLPKAERRGGGISKEIWEAFAADYVAVMPGVTGKSAEAVGNAAKLLLGKFQAVKTNKPVLRLLKDQLALYLTNSPNAETYQECVEFLDGKADALLAMDEAALLNNL